MEMKLNHSESRSKHKCFSLGRITSTFCVFALIALVYAGMLSGTASGSNSVPKKIGELMTELQAFEARAEVLVQRIKDSANTELTNAKNEMINNTDAAETGILQFIRDTHLVDPFDVAVNICTEIEGDAAIEGLAGLGITAALKVQAGIDFYGNGAQIELSPAGKVEGGLSLSSVVGMSVTACINGIFARQNNEVGELDAVVASLGNQNEIDFIAELFDTGKRYRNRVMGTAINTNLVVNGQDRLNTSLDGFEGFTTLDAAMLGEFLVNSFDGSGSTPLDVLVRDLSGVGSGVGTVLFDLAGVVDLSDGSVSAIGDSIETGMSTLGFGSGYGDGLNALTSGLDLVALSNAIDSFKGIEVVINGIEFALDTIIDTINDIL